MGRVLINLCAQLSTLGVTRFVFKMEPTGRFELPTCCLQNSCSAS